MNLKWMVFAALVGLVAPVAQGRESFLLAELGHIQSEQSIWPYFDKGQLQTTPPGLAAIAEQSCRELIPDCPKQHAHFSAHFWSSGAPNQVLLNCLCMQKPDGAGPNFILASIDFQGKRIWQIPDTDPRMNNNRILGADRNQILLNSGEVLDLKTGESMSRLPQDGKSSAPDALRFADSGVVHPRLGIFSFVSALSDDPKGGLYRFDRDGGNAQRWFNAGTRWLVLYHEEARTLALSPDGRWLFAGTIWSARGPSPAQLTIYDLDRRRIAKRLDLTGSDFLNVDSIVTGPDGQLALRLSAPGQPYRVMLLRWAPDS